jgi:hypothetical protein
MHVQELPFQKEIRFLNSLKLEQLSGSEFHKTGAAYLNELLPYLDDFTCGICNRLVYRKLYLWSCF